MHTQHMKNICAHSRTSPRSCGCVDALVCRVRRSPRVQGAQSAQVPHVQGEDVTSAACGRISCVPTFRMRRQIHFVGYDVKYIL